MSIFVIVSQLIKSGIGENVAYDGGSTRGTQIVVCASTSVYIYVVAFGFPLFT
jgi:hypothetical protein